MRTSTILIGALLLASPALAQDQQQQTSGQTAAQTMATPASSFVPKYGKVDFGYRGDDITGDEARYNRLRDFRDGGYVSRFVAAKETDTFLLRGEANNIGYRDQRFFGGYEYIGRAKATFEWNQVPLFLAKNTPSLYTHTGNGVLDVNDSVQQAIQSTSNNTARDAAIANALASANTLDLRSRRDLGTFNLVYTVNRDIDLKMLVRNTNRTGNQVMSFGFGTSPGLNPSVELGAPIDDRTTDIRGALEFANAKGLLSVGWDSSWYNNSIPFIQFDNPLRFTNINAGAAVGQAAWWPGNSALSVNVNGSYKLARRTRASAAFSVGRWEQDEALPPPSVNTALVLPTLERATAETRADIRTMLFGFNSRPTSNLLLTAKYRYYDYENKTPHFAVSNAIIGDWANGTQFHETEPASFKRKTLDLDASFTPFRYAGFGVGYGREDGDRTWRIFEKTTEDVLRLTFDSLGNQYVSLRTKYEYSERRGSGFDSHLLDEVGEQPDMRHFDIANRDRSRFTTQLTVTPVSYLSLTGSVGTGDDDYTDTGFGLRDSENRNWSLGFDVAPGNVVNFGMGYGYDKYTAITKHRTALPPGNASGPNEFFDPRRDWTTDQDDVVKTISANLDLVKALPKTDMRFGYDFSDGSATYLYGTRDDAPRVSTPGVESAIPVPVQLPELKNRLTVGRFDVQHFVRPNVALGLAYHYEEYKVQDFSLDTTTIDRLDPKNASGTFASTLYAGYLFKPYRANTWYLRMTYLW